MMELFEDRFVNVEGLQVRYWLHGEKGPFLLLIHGIGACVEYWSQNISALSKHFRVIALDLPGFGKSDKPEIDYSIDFYAHFLAAFLKAIQVEELYVVGHSLGGVLALGFVLNHQERVKKLVLVDNVGFALPVIIFFRLMALPIIGPRLLNLSKEMYRKALQTNVHDPSVITDELVDVLYPLARQPGTQHTMSYIIKHNTNLWGISKKALEPLWARYHELEKLPILLFWGKQDRLLPCEEHVKAAQEWFPHLQLVLVDNCGHIPQLEHPTFFNDTVIQFLNSEI